MLEITRLFVLDGRYARKSAPRVAAGRLQFRFAARSIRQRASRRREVGRLTVGAAFKRGDDDDAASRRAGTAGGRPHRAAVCQATRLAAARDCRNGRPENSITWASLSPALRRSRTSTRRSCASGASESSIDWFWHTMQRNSLDTRPRALPAPDRASTSSGCDGVDRRRAATSARQQHENRPLQPSR